MDTRLLLAIAALAIAACSTDDSSPPNDASAPEALADPCTAFTDAGNLCPVVTPHACFPLCATGGCFCLEGLNGAPPRWHCTVDTSCLPDGSPVEDQNAPDVPLPDSGPGSDAADAGVDASDASDATTNDAADAGADAADAADGAG